MRLLLTLTLALLPSLAAAQDTRRPSHCIAVANADPAMTYVHKARFGSPLPDDFTVRLSYIDHAMFLLETPGGLTAVTDYIGYTGTAGLVPDIVTMNNAHSSHYTDFPQQGIDHVLHGWAVGGVPADHHLDLGEMLVRNVPTDVRSRFETTVRANGNSIFVFEVGGLCIGHLGHLHHMPDDRQFASLGRLDVVMAPVDGGLTLPIEDMIAVLARLRSSLVIPMHWWGRGSLDSFLAGMAEGGFAVRDTTDTALEVSLRTLPSRPTVIVLRPQFLTRSP